EMVDANEPAAGWAALIGGFATLVTACVHVSLALQRLSHFPKSGRLVEITFCRSFIAARPEQALNPRHAAANKEQKENQEKKASHEITAVLPYSQLDRVDH